MGLNSPGSTNRENYAFRDSFIEVSFPVKEVGEESAREKNIRDGHISTLHIWWARKPLAASRATTYAALIPALQSDEELRAKNRFIAELAKWENTRNPAIVEKAKKELGAFRVLNPFAGGGSIPLECVRLKMGEVGV